MIALAAVALICCSGAIAYERASSHDIKSAIIVTPAMIRAAAIPNQDSWYKIILPQIRQKEFRLGYVHINVTRNSAGNVVLTRQLVLRESVYSANVLDFNIEQTVVMSAKTGLPLSSRYKFHYFDNYSNYNPQWSSKSGSLIGSKTDVEKTAVFDYAKNRIIVRYGSDGKVQKTFPIEKNTVPQYAELGFMLAGAPMIKSGYKFRFFDMRTEKYQDKYFRYEGPAKDGSRHFAMLDPAYRTAGEGVWTNTSLWYEEYWTGAKNGVASTFTKMEFVPPNVSLFRVLPVTKKEALEKTDSTVD